MIPTLLGWFAGPAGWSLVWGPARFWFRHFKRLAPVPNIRRPQGVAGVYSEVRRDEDATKTEMAGSLCDRATIPKDIYQSHRSRSSLLGARLRASGLSTMSVDQGSPKVRCRHQEDLCGFSRHGSPRADCASHRRWIFPCAAGNIPPSAG